MTRVYERDLDTLFIESLRNNDDFLASFMKSATGDFKLPYKLIVSGQTKHRGSSGSIDIELNFYESKRLLLIENKIDARYSITLSGLGQVDRYKKTTNILRKAGVDARSVLLAPKSYRIGTKFADQFDSYVDYESLRDTLFGKELELLESAINQTSLPYEPVLNVSTTNFFEKYRVFVSTEYPHLKLKSNPNAGGVRPSGSNTIYFDVQKTLVLHNNFPKPRMSLQFLDSNHSTASVKIMIGKWGKFSNELKLNSAFDDIGAYLRPAGQSLGLVIDTPRLNTQEDFHHQLEDIVEGLEAASRLQTWWNTNGRKLKELNNIVNQKDIKK